ncbi:MAG: hypothetical protein J6A58_08735 [Oscillospiraceae bacterium]|nr:hypothetical protein [Oscillospiraceae bacterium]
MPITLIRSNKDNVVHGTDNERTTGCRIRLQGMNCTREGEMKDIVDLTCDRCKEVFATKLIRESNREDARMAKEEKKRFLRAKKQGIVSESTYEEYVLNRESEAASRRDSHDANNNETAAPTNNNYQNYQSYQNYQAQTTPQPAPSVQPTYNNTQQSIQQPIPQATSMVNPEFTFAKEQINPDIKLSYAPSYESYISGGQSSPTAAVQPEQSVYQPQQPVESAPQYQPEQPAEPVPQYQQYQSYTGQSSVAESAPAKPKAADDDFLSQFMVKREDTVAPQPQVSTPQSSSTAGEILSAANDILAQFNKSVEEKEKEEAQAHSNAFVGDASSFYSNQIPLVDVSSSGSKSISDINNEGYSNEFGSLNIPEKKVSAPSNDFVVPEVPVFAPKTSSMDSIGSYASTPSVFDELVSDDVSSSVGSFESVSVLEPTANGFQTVTPPSMQSFDTVTPPVQPMQSFDTVTPPVQPMQSFDTVTPPVQPMQSFDTVTPPVQPMQSFDTVTPPVQPMQSFDTVTPPVQPMQSFDTVTPPAQPMQSFEPVTPPVQPMQNNFVAVPPVQPVNQFVNPMGVVNNGFGVQQNNYQQPAGYGQQYNQPQQPFVNPAQNMQPQNVFGSAPSNSPSRTAPIFTAPQRGMVDSIEEALKQLGAEGIQTAEEKAQNEKEEIVPDFIAYVPASSKALYNKPPVNDLTSTSSKRILSAREAKKLAKIDAKFYKDLKERGFTPAEMRSQRRGK